MSIPETDERWLMCLDRAIALGAHGIEDAIAKAQKLYDALPTNAANHR